MEAKYSKTNADLTTLFGYVHIACNAGSVQLKHSFMQRPIVWMGKNRCGWIEIWVVGWWQVKKEGAKKVFQNHMYCQLCLRRECKWCHMCVCSPHQVIRHTTL